MKKQIPLITLILIAAGVVAGIFVSTGASAEPSPQAIAATDHRPRKGFL